MTNNHVVDDAHQDPGQLRRQDNKYDAKLIGTDQRTDLALLKIEPTEHASRSSSSRDKTPRVGDWVIAVGNPFGLGGTVTAGIVSALGRDIGSGPYDYMQIDAAVNRGNSGGPTFNLEGEVIGVNTAIYCPSGGSVGIAFAIPAETATRGRRRSSRPTARSAAAGSASRSRTSTTTWPPASASTSPRARWSPRSPPTGPAAAPASSPATRSCRSTATKVDDSRDLARKIAGFAPDTKVDVTFWRDGKEQTVEVKLGTFPRQQG